MSTRSKENPSISVNFLQSIIKGIPNSIIVQHKQVFRRGNSDSDKIKFLDTYLQGNFEQNAYGTLKRMLDNYEQMDRFDSILLAEFIVSLLSETRGLVSNNSADATPMVSLPEVQTYRLFYVSDSRFKQMRLSGVSSGFFVVPNSDDIGSVFASRTLTMGRLFSGEFGIDKRPIRLFELGRDASSKNPTLRLNGEPLSNISSDNETIRALIRVARKLEEVETNRISSKNRMTYAEPFAMGTVQLDMLQAYHSLALPQPIVSVNWNVIFVDEDIDNPIMTKTKIKSDVAVVDTYPISSNQKATEEKVVMTQVQTDDTLTKKTPIPIENNGKGKGGKGGKGKSTEVVEKGLTEELIDDIVQANDLNSILREAATASSSSS